MTILYPIVSTANSTFTGDFPYKVGTLDTCDIALLQPFVRCMESRGVPTERYLERQRIAPALAASGVGTIARLQAWRLCAEVERKEGFDALGFLQGDPYSIADLGSVGAALQQAVTLQDAIETFCTLLPTIADDNSAHLIRGEELSWFVVRCTRFQYEFSVLDHYTILPLREIVRLAAGPDWRPEKIRLLTGPKPALDRLPDTAEIETFFNQDVVGIALKTELLAAPVRQSNFHHEPVPQKELSTTKSVTESESLYRFIGCSNRCSHIDEPCPLPTRRPAFLV
jgi:hypothetical protein